MSSQLNATTLGVNNTSPAYNLHCTGSGQIGTLLLSTTNSSSTSVRGEIGLNDGTRVMTVTNNGVASMLINSTGQVSFNHNTNKTVTTPSGTASVTSTNWINLSGGFQGAGAGVYLVLTCNCSGNSSSTLQLIDNLCKVLLVICSSAAENCQVVSLYNPNNSFYSITSSGQFTMNLNVVSGSFQYRYFWQKLF